MLEATLAPRKERKTFRDLTKNAKPYITLSIYHTGLLSYHGLRSAMVPAEKGFVHSPLSFR